MVEERKEERKGKRSQRVYIYNVCTIIITQ